MNAHPVEALSALLDDELPPAERASVEAHLATCASCARHLRELGAVDELARGLPPVGAPDGYLETLPGRVRRRIRADRPRLARASWVLPLAAGVALAVLTPIVLQQRREVAPPQRPAVAMQEPAAPTAPPPETVPPAAEGVPAPRPQARGGALRREAAPVAAPPAAPAPPPADTTTPETTTKARDAFAPPPAAYATAEQDRAAQRANAGEEGVAAGARAAAPAEAELKATGDERVDAPAPMAGRVGAASSLKKEDAPGREERAFRALAALPLSTAGQARHARGAWLRFLADHPDTPRRDEALVRVVEASVAAFRDGADPGDRVRAERDAAAYLSRPDAPQKARVQAALRRLEEPR